MSKYWTRFLSLFHKRESLLVQELREQIASLEQQLANERKDFAGLVHLYSEEHARGKKWEAIARDTVTAWRESADTVKLRVNNRGPLASGNRR